MQQSMIRQSLLIVAVLVISGGAALAESTYGYASSGAGTVTATARINLSVTVPKLILLRVGSASTIVNTAAWTVGASIPTTPVAPVNGNNAAANWNVNAPTLTATASSAAFVAFAWTNATTPTINCAVGAWSAAGGPTNADFTVTATGTLLHPGANLGACTSTSFPSSAVVSGTWQYTLGGTPATWKAGTYTNTVTYTATGV